MFAFLVVATVDKADTEKDVNTQEGTAEGEKIVEPLQPRALHKTQSIFLKNLPALISRQEIEEVDMFTTSHCLVC